MLSSRAEISRQECTPAGCRVLVKDGGGGEIRAVCATDKLFAGNANIQYICDGSTVKAPADSWSASSPCPVGSVALGPQRISSTGTVRALDCSMSSCRVKMSGGFGFLKTRCMKSDQNKKKVRSVLWKQNQFMHRPLGFKVGERIEANYLGKGNFFAGKIARVNPDGTYFIHYDDGDREDRVSANLITGDWANQHQKCPYGKVMVGLASEHSKAKNDRKFIQHS